MKTKELVERARHLLNQLTNNTALQDEIENDPDVDCMIGRYWHGEDLEPYRDTAISVIEKLEGYGYK